jgi:excisionase family DNA binding protein
MYSCKEVAVIFRLTPMTIWRMAKDGRLPYIRVGRTIRFKKEDIDYIVDGGTGSAKWVRQSSSEDDDVGMV